jgi:hypothetical protein
MNKGRSAGASLVAVLLLAACGRAPAQIEGGGETTAEPAGSPSPSPSYLRDNERWSPPTYREDGRLVMPVTFPDGTRAELAYPPKLALERLSAYPDTYADDGSRDCGSSVSGTLHNPHGHSSWVVGETPLWEYTRSDGSTVQLWEATPAHGGTFLVYRFGRWTVLVPCTRSVGDEDLRVWAEGLHGEEASDGLLVLDSTPPLVVNPWRDHPPVIRFSDRDVVFELSPDSAQCDPPGREEGDTGAGDGVVQWCIQP